MGLVLTCFSGLSECSEEIQFEDLLCCDIDDLWLFTACYSGYVLMLFNTTF